MNAALETVVALCPRVCVQDAGPVALCDLLMAERAHAGGAQQKAKRHNQGSVHLGGDGVLGGDEAAAPDDRDQHQRQHGAKVQGAICHARTSLIFSTPFTR